jgi:hypothetical protein
MSLLVVPEIMKTPFLSRFVTKSSASNISVFISTVVVVAGFFSFIFGSLVYLRFENDLRIDVERVRLAMLSELQTQCRDLFAKQAPLSEEEQSRLERIKVMADYLAMPGYFRTSLQTLGTTLVAIFPPAVAITVALLKYSKP